MLIQEPPAELGGGVWMLGTKAYPLYLIRAQGEAAIVEGGISALGPVLQTQLAELGVGPADVRQAIITHAHPDHVMAIPCLRAMFPELSVAASAAAATTLGVEKAVAFFRQVDSALTDVLRKAGAIGPDAVLAPVEENRIAIDRTLREGDCVTVGDRTWSVLETPGHSDCSISLHEPASGVLIISDATGYLLPAGDAWWPNYFTGYGIYVRSIERLAALDAEIVCLSHNGAVCGREAVHAYFAGALESTRQYHQRIVDEAKAGKPARQIAEELGAEIHRQTPVLPVDFFQKNCALMIKQSLKHEGIAPA